MVIDFMGVKRICAKCKSPGDDVAWSEHFYMYVCDECYTDMNDEIEDARSFARDDGKGYSDDYNW